MSWQAWFFLIVGALALMLFLGGVVAKALSGGRSEGGPEVTITGSIVVFVIALIVLLTGAFTIVGTRQVGIATSFGKPTGQTYSNGLHWKAPWVEVTEMDAAIQNDTYKGESRIAVRLGNNSTALADVSIRWQIKQDAADTLFVDYKTFDNVRANLITRNLQAALNESFAKFDPLATKNLESSPLPELANNTANLLRGKVGTQVEIFAVTIPTIDYDDETEKRINDINAERARTTAAGQAVKTAEQTRKANEQLATAPAPPNALVIIQTCINKALDKGQNPAGCWPIGGNVVPTLAVPNPGQ
ncbi:Gp116 [Mycolicibacterium canariasense]|uniref:Gp116 n=1 Tax=Mycolicibacterium canariasense TaxID=228230 RepID=A0A100WKG9_MYCCR|nr:SPFH domain-containing protein [Mycolicibacterium canariasense]GAS99880.1 Gp116 [Mycolicibacterium canariasense]